MKKILMLGALAAASLIYSQPSEAHGSGRWCAKANIGAGAQAERCEFATFAACQRSIRNESRSFCVQSQYYTEYAPREEVIVVPAYRTYRVYRD